MTSVAGILGTLECELCATMLCALAADVEVKLRLPA
jgi:hypothetical protein